MNCLKLSDGDVTSHRLLYYPNCLVSLYKGSVTTSRHRNKRENKRNWHGPIPFSPLDYPLTSVKWKLPMMVLIRRSLFLLIWPSSITRRSN